jgi:ribonuclease Z
MPELTFVGTGEAFDPDLPNTSLLYRGHRTLLIDCGYSVPEAFWRLFRDPDLVDGVYLSHRHADHSFGLPALLFWMKLGGRQRSVTLLGGPELDPWLDELLDFAYPGSFGADFFRCDHLPISPGAEVAFGSLVLRTAVSEHAVRNTALSISDGALRVCYSGDGGPTAETRELYRGATVLVHECFAPVGPRPGHADAETLLTLADELEVGTLALVHLSQEEKEEVRQVVDRTRTRCRVLVPSPGETLELE